MPLLSRAVPTPALVYRVGERPATALRVHDDLMPGALAPCGDKQYATVVIPTPPSAKLRMEIDEVVGDQPVG